MEKSTVIVVNTTVILRRNKTSGESWFRSRKVHTRTVTVTRLGCWYLFVFVTHPNSSTHPPHSSRNAFPRFFHQLHHSLQWLNVHDAPCLSQPEDTISGIGFCGPRSFKLATSTWNIDRRSSNWLRPGVSLSSRSAQNIAFHCLLLVVLEL